MAGVGDRLKDLEGRPRGEDGKNQPREFFWDSIVLYVVFSIIGLTVVDVISEYVRGSSVQCFTDLDNGATNEYVNNLCSSSVSVSEYFPVFMIVHGVLIGIPHYLWLNHYGGCFEFFFQLTSSMDRLRDYKTGEYSENNYLTVEQLVAAFATYKRNWIYRLYVAKLILQWFLTVAGFIVAIVYFTDFNDNFLCPRMLNDTLDITVWPLPNQQVNCIFTSLRLIELIRVADLVLLAIVLLGLTWSLIWCASTHSSELGTKDVAKFSFQSGLSPKYYIPKLPIFVHKYIDSIPWPFSLHGPRIKTDLDFMVMKLFRTDGGLGHVLREVQIYKEIKNMSKDERRRLYLHSKEQTRGGGLIDKDDAKSDLKWRFMSVEDGVYNSYSPWPYKLVLPNSLRGAVLGYASLAMSNEGALCITFGSPSPSFADALGRIFFKVGCFNFSPYYHPEKDSPVKVDTDMEGIVSVLCPEDFLTADDSNNDKTLLDASQRIWVTPSDEEDSDEENESSVEPPTRSSFIFIGAMDKKTHKSTVNFLLDLLVTNEYIADDALLLYIHPREIAGKKLEAKLLEKETFCTYTPPEKHFIKSGKRDVEVLERVKQMPWYAIDPKKALSAVRTEDKARARGAKQDDAETEQQALEMGSLSETVPLAGVQKTAGKLEESESIDEDIVPDQHTFSICETSSGEYSLVLRDEQKRGAFESDFSGGMDDAVVAPLTRLCRAKAVYKASDHESDLPLLVGDAPVKFRFSLYERNKPANTSSDAPVAE